MSNITDGTATFKVRDVRQQALIDLIYPVGSIYTTEDENFNPNTAWGGTWEKTAQGRFLEGASISKPGTTIEAGLPNINGYFEIRGTAQGTSTTPPFSYDDDGSPHNPVGTTSQNAVRASVRFNASTSSPIYGRSNTVQPAAEFVIFWKRTA